MNKALMISIQPQHAVNILNGKKTLELRTWIPKGYVGWVYAYVTKGKPYLIKNTSYQWLKGNIISYTLSNNTLFFEDVLNGKVAFRFWFDEYEGITLDDDLEICTNETTHETLLKQSCVDYNHLNNYFMNENGDTFGYAWHIKQLEVFDEPKQLSEFALVSNYKHIVEKMTPYEKSMLIFGNTLKKAPQRSAWVYVEDKE